MKKQQNNFVKNNQVGLQMQKRVVAILFATLSITAVHASEPLLPPTIISVKTFDGSAGTEGSFDPKFSANGRYVFFGSNGPLLLPPDPLFTEINSASYRYDLKTNQLMELVDQYNEPMFAESISQSGDILLYSSSQIYRYIITSGQTQMVSAAYSFGWHDDINDPIPANNLSGEPAISANGHFAVFVTRASNLFNPPTACSGTCPPDSPYDDHYQVYRRALESEKVELVSMAYGNLPGTVFPKPGSGDSTQPSITQDGNLVLFASSANNLIHPPGEACYNAPPPCGEHQLGYGNIYLRNMATQEIQLVSSLGGTTPDEIATQAFYAQNPFITPSGRYIFFEAFDDRLPDAGEQTQIYRRLGATGTIERVSLPVSADQPHYVVAGSYTVSDDGNKIAYLGYTNDGIEDYRFIVGQIYVRDMTTKKVIKLTNVNATQNPFSALDAMPPNLVSLKLSLSGDGRYLAYNSKASTLPKANGYSQIYVQDLQAYEPPNTRAEVIKNNQGDTQIFGFFAPENKDMWALGSAYVFFSMPGTEPFAPFSTFVANAQGNWQTFTSCWFLQPTFRGRLTTIENIPVVPTPTDLSWIKGGNLYFGYGLGILNLQTCNDMVSRKNWVNVYTVD